MAFTSFFHVQERLNYHAYVVLYCLLCKVSLTDCPTTATGVTCTFPFVDSSRYYPGCTLDHDASNYMCKTGGQWHYCREDYRCPTVEGTQLT